MRGIFFRLLIIFLKINYKINNGSCCFIYRAELEASYAKGLTKLSSKLTKACSKDQGTVKCDDYLFLYEDGQ